MKREDLDRILMDEMGQLPPEPASLSDYTPWRASITKVLWGMALTTFKLEFLYLQYLLPLLGAVLLYLGYRSLRGSSRWFKLCWIISGVLLVWHAAGDVLTATPLIQRVANSPANWPLISLGVFLHILLLAALRAGIREAFAATDGGKPKDWIGRGLIAYLLCQAIALWGTLVPLTEQTLFGMTIIHELRWLHTARGIAFIALEIYLMRCIYRQSEALADRGYDIVPVPVRVSAKKLILAVFLVVLAAIPPALWLSGRLDMAPAEPMTALSQEHAVTRERLIALGLPEDIAHALDEDELTRCADALDVAAAPGHDTDLSDDYDPPMDGPAMLFDLDGGRAELSSWIIFLPDGQYRRIQWFEYRETPGHRLQEQFSVDPIGNYPSRDYAGRLLWEKDGVTWTSTPDIRLSGGQTADELTEDQIWWYQHELERLGHIHYSPYFSFSIPRNGDGMRGYLAYTLDRSDFPDTSKSEEFSYLFLRHQSGLLHYPFKSVDDLGGIHGAKEYGPIESVSGSFGYYGPSPY